MTTPLRVARGAQTLIGLTMLLTLLLFATSAHAADRAFVTRFSANDTGAITRAANALLACPAGSSAGSTSCATAQATGADASGNANLNNNVFDMQRVGSGTATIDGVAGSTLIDSSSADVTIPAGATVLFAGLYWGADLSAGANASPAGPTPTAAPTPAADNKAVLKVPGAAGYTTVTASQLDTSSTDASRYQGFADITSQVKAAGTGT